MWKEFKEFAMQGNLVDMAVAFVMGGAFGKVATAFTEGIIAPLFSILTSGVDLNHAKWVLKPAIAEIKDATGTVTMPAVSEIAVNYGTFITHIIDFLIVAFAMFMVIKTINAAKKKQTEAPAPAPEPPRSEILLEEIRNLLKNR